SASPQDLGVLFPDELQAGLTVRRGPGSGAGAASAPTEDDYVIQILQNQYYSFMLSGDALPDGTRVTLTDATGQAVPLLSSPDGRDFFAPVTAGTYTADRRPEPAPRAWRPGASEGVGKRQSLGKPRGLRGSRPQRSILSSRQAASRSVPRRPLRTA